MQIAIITLIAVILALLGAFWLPDPATRTQGAALVGVAMVLAVYSYFRVESVWPRPEPHAGKAAQPLAQGRANQRRLGLILLACAALLVLWSLYDIWSHPFAWDQATRWMVGLILGMLGTYLLGGGEENNGEQSQPLNEAPRQDGGPDLAHTKKAHPKQSLGPRPAGYKLEAIGREQPHSDDQNSDFEEFAGTVEPTNLIRRSIGVAVYEPKIPRWLEIILLLAIMGIAIWLRVSNIEQMPPGIFIDETNAALDGLQILEGRPSNLFGTGWFETPNGFVYLQTLFFRILGTTFLSVKLQSLLPGILSVLALYLLGKELFGTRPALIGAAFMAVNRWHFNMSRWGWNEVYPPLIQILALYFIQRAARLRNWGDWAMAGFLLGLGMYTYLGIRLAVVAIAIYLLYRILVERGFLRLNWQGLVLFTTLYVLTSAPLGFTYYKNPFTFLNRSQQVSILHDIEMAQGELEPLWSSIEQHLQMFHVSGDRNPRHNLPGEPMLDPITGAFFLLGLAWALWCWRDHKHGLLLIWIGVTLLGGVLSRLDEAPQAYRTLAVVPAIALLAADAYDLSLRGLIFRARRYNMWRWLWAFLAVAGLVATASLNYNTYFNKQAKDPSVYIAFSPLETTVSREVVAKRSDHQLYLSPRLYYFSPLRFFAYQPSQEVGIRIGPFKYSPFDTLGGGLEQPGYQQTDPALDLPLPDLGGDNALFLLDLHFEHVLDLFRYYYPGTQAEIVKDRFDKPLYLSVTIPGNEISALQAQNRIAEADEIKGLYIPESGPYTLTILSPDSSSQPRILLDGAPFETGPVFLGKGLHALDLVGVSNTTLSSEQTLLTWEGPSVSGAIPDQYLFLKAPSGQGLLGTYYQGSDWAPPPLMQRLDPLLLAAWPEAEPVFGSFSATWSGEILIPRDGLYRFRLHADDGVRFWLDGEMQAESVNPDTNNLAAANLELQAGPHPIRIDYFQGGGGKALEFFWQQPGGSLQPVAPRYLRPVPE